MAVQKVLSLTQILDLSYISQFIWASPAQKLKQIRIIFSSYICGNLLRQQKCSAMGLLYVRGL